MITTNEAAPRLRGWEAAIFVAALLPLLATPVLPFIDYYNHVARYTVLANIDHTPWMQANYAAHWQVLPNIGMDVIGTALLRFLPVTVAAHLMIAGIMAVEYAGLLYFQRGLQRPAGLVVPLLGVWLLYSFILNWGFANFLLGLGLTFWAAGWWLRHRDRPARATPLAALLAVGIFLCHGVAFALYGLLLGGIEIGFFLAAPARRWGDLARRLALLALQAVVPVVLFALTPTEQVAGGVTNADASIQRLRDSGGLVARLARLLHHRVETIVRVGEGPSYLFDAATVAVLAAMLLWAARRGSLGFARALWPAIAICVVLVAVCPPALFGVGYVADRMPLFLAFVLTAGVAMRRRDRALELGLAALVAVRLIAIAADWRGYARDAAEFEQIAALIPPGSLVDDVIVGGSRHEGERRYTMYRPLLVARYGQVGPLFAYASQQPLRLAGPLAAALAKLPPASTEFRPEPRVYDDMIAAAGSAGFRYLLVMNAGQLTRPYPKWASVIARTPRFTLLRLDYPPMVSRTM